MCAFYTKGTPYEREARKLKKSCIKFNIPLHLVGIEPKATWAQNCGQKPRIILETLLEHPDTNVVYLDSDARIMRPPELFDSFSGDIGVHYLNGHELLSGTIFLRNTDGVKDLVALWITAQENNPEAWDQWVLQDCLRRFGPHLGIKVMTIPATYCQIHDIMKLAGKPVIKHMQASRAYKKLVTK